MDGCVSVDSKQLGQSQRATLMIKSSDCHRAFERALPGGGFVAIDIASERTIWRNRVFHGTLVVERRASERRAGHSPPVVALSSGSSLDSVIQHLLPTAQCNAAIGAALMDLERRHGKDNATKLGAQSGSP